MRRNRLVVRGAVLFVLAGLAFGASSCQTTTDTPPLYDHFTIVNEGPVPIHDVWFRVADVSGMILDEQLLRQGQPIHPGEEVTWRRDRIPGMPPLAEQVRCELLYEGPEGPLEATAAIDPWGPPIFLRFRFMENPEKPGEFQLLVE